MTARLHPLRPPLMGSALIIAAAAGFSSKSIFIKLAYLQSQELDAISLLALRMAFSLPFFLAIALGHQYYAKPDPLTRHEWGILFGLGFLGYYLSSFFDFWG